MISPSEPNFLLALQQTVPPPAIFRIFLSMHSNLLEGVEHDHLVQFPINVVMISKILLTFYGKPRIFIG